jgi:predicted dehydrogenase
VSGLRVAVIGAGHLGKIHARLLPEIEGVTLVAIADPSPAVHRNLIDKTDVPVLSDYRKIVDEIDAAVVATPTHGHFDIAQDLLSRSLHVLIEKPITDCPYQARQLLELAQQNDCVLSVGHVEQHNPAVRFAFEAVGQPRFIQAARLSGYTFRSTDIGVVHDLMIHDIDLCNTAFPGKMIRSHACGFSVFGGHEDVAQARIQFNCGGVANLTASRCSFDAQRSMQIFGTEGFASIDLNSHTVKSIRFPDWLKQQQFDFQTATPQQREFVKAKLFEQILPLSETVPPKTNAILAEQREWVECIQSGRPMRNTAGNAAEAVRIAGQVLEQIEHHRWNRPEFASDFAVADSNAMPAGMAMPIELQPQRQAA